MLEICAVGGYSEVGKNMTAVRYKDSVIILDMGLHMENYISYKGDEDVEFLSTKKLSNLGVIPDTTPIKDWISKTEAIFLSHAHLDHIGAVPFLAEKFNCDIYGSPYTIEVLKAILSENNIEIPNRLITLQINDKVKIGEIEIEFINATHSTPDPVFIYVKTPEDSLLYANDFKLDKTPTIGPPPNFSRLKEIDCDVLIAECLYADHEGHCPSEAKARELLKQSLEDTNGKGIIITTFSSHIARLKSITEFGINRKVVFLGRSLAKYCYAAQNIDIEFPDVKICGYMSQIKKMLRTIEEKGHENYLIVATGHQGEEDAVLSKIAMEKFPFKITENDIIIFSCITIPTVVNYQNRERLEFELQKHKAKILTKVHASGHAWREDHRNLIEMVKPKLLIPAHAGHEKARHMLSLANEMNIKCSLMSDGEIIYRK